MTGLTSSDKWPHGDIRTFWKEEVARPLTHADVTTLETDLGLWMHSAFKPFEYVVGQRSLDPDSETLRELANAGILPGWTYLRALRRHGATFEPLPGIALELCTSLVTDDSSRWEGLRAQCAVVLSGLGLGHPEPGAQLLFTGKEEA